MKSDVIVVSSRGRQMEKALEQTAKVAAYKGLSEKNALQLRLLTEEMMGMMRSITGETEGRFWIEDEDGLYQLHLKVSTRMTTTKREQLLSVSSTGENESAKGLMGRLRDLFDRSADDDIAAYTNSLMLSGSFDSATVPGSDWTWSMSEYEEALAQRVDRREASALEAWDELEKSVVKNVADEVKVSIRGETTEMIILKKLA